MTQDSYDNLLDAVRNAIAWIDNMDSEVDDINAPIANGIENALNALQDLEYRLDNFAIIN